ASARGSSSPSSFDLLESPAALVGVNPVGAVPAVRRTRKGFAETMEQAVGEVVAEPFAQRVPDGETLAPERHDMTRLTVGKDFLSGQRAGAVGTQADGTGGCPALLGVQR